MRSHSYVIMENRFDDMSSRKNSFSASWVPMASVSKHCPPRDSSSPDGAHMTGPAVPAYLALNVDCEPLESSIRLHICLPFTFHKVMPMKAAQKYFLAE